MREVDIKFFTGEATGGLQERIRNGVQEACIADYNAPSIKLRDVEQS